VCDPRPDADLSGNAGERLGEREPAVLTALAAARARTLELTRGLDQVQLDAAPPGGGWSVGEVLDHLLRAEAVNRGEIAGLVALARSGRRPYVRRSFAELDLAPAFIPKSWLPLLTVPFTLATLWVPSFAIEALVRNRLLPARAPRVLQPRKGRPAAELRAELESSLSETRALFAAHRDLDFRRLVLQHPVLGTHDAFQIVRLIAAHEERHQQQIRELVMNPF